MKRQMLLWSACLLFLYVPLMFAQVHIKGSLNASLYAWQNANETQLWDTYLGSHFRISPANARGHFLNTYFRVAHRGDPAKWEERFYNLYLNIKLNRSFQFRLGRQFLYNGVLNGTVDGLLLQGRAASWVKFKLLAGTRTPWDRKLEVTSWNEGAVLGGFADFAFTRNHSLQLSYLRQSRRTNGATRVSWEQFGTTLTGYLFRQKLNYFGRLDYNLQSQNYQQIRFRLTYLGRKLTASAEYNSQRPRIWEDSFFNIFEINAFNQARLAATYRWNQMDLGLQYLYTTYKDGTDNRIIGTLGTRYGTFGVVYQSGIGESKNLGLYGDLRFNLLPNLTARLFGNYYNFERAYTNITEDAIGYSAGLSYRLNRNFLLRGDVQQMTNSYYNHDWRGLFHLTYLFGI